MYASSGLRKYKAVGFPVGPYTMKGEPQRVQTMKTGIPEDFFNAREPEVGEIAGDF